MKLAEFDNEKTAVLNPEHFYNRLSDCPKTVVTCFAVNLIEYAVNTYPSRVICNWSSSNGVIPFYEIEVNGEKIGIIMSMIGAPSAVAEYEELFAMGVENILVFGTCGVLDKSISDCSVIVPVSAVRDEGTSFHYLPDSDEIEVNVGLQHKITNYLKKKKIKHTVGKTWTTDAIYRETKAKVQKRKKDVLALIWNALQLPLLLHLEIRVLHSFFTRQIILTEMNTKRGALQTMQTLTLN